MLLKQEYRGVATAGDRGAMVPPSISEPNKVQQFQFQKSGKVFRNYMDQKLSDFYRV